MPTTDLRSRDQDSGLLYDMRKAFLHKHCSKRPLCSRLPMHQTNFPRRLGNTFNKTQQIGLIGMGGITPGLIHLGVHRVTLAVQEHPTVTRAIGENSPTWGTFGLVAYKEHI